jgi:hypothetical protein
MWGALVKALMGAFTSGGGGGGLGDIISTVGGGGDSKEAPSGGGGGGGEGTDMSKPVAPPSIPSGGPVGETVSGPQFNPESLQGPGALFAPTQPQGDFWGSPMAQAPSYDSQIPLGSGTASGPSGAPLGGNAGFNQLLLQGLSDKLGIDLSKLESPPSSQFGVQAPGYQTGAPALPQGSTYMPPMGMNFQPPAYNMQEPDPGAVLAEILFGNGGKFYN